MYTSFLIACSILFVVPLIFVTHNVYQDGVFGRIGLLGISFSSSLFLMEATVGVQYDILPQTVFLAWAFAVFLVWHLFRFHCRVLRKGL